MVAVPRDEREPKQLRSGARGRYAPPPQLFPLALIEWSARLDSPLTIERDADGAYLLRQRATGRLVARTANPATLQRLLVTLGG